MKSAYFFILFIIISILGCSESPDVSRINSKINQLQNKIDSIESEYVVLQTTADRIALKCVNEHLADTLNKYGILSKDSINSIIANYIEIQNSLFNEWQSCKNDKCTDDVYCSQCGYQFNKWSDASKLFSHLKSVYRTLYSDTIFYGTIDGLYKPAWRMDNGELDSAILVVDGKNVKLIFSDGYNEIFKIGNNIESGFYRFLSSYNFIYRNYEIVLRNDTLFHITKPDTTEMFRILREEECSYYIPEKLTDEIKQIEEYVEEDFPILESKIEILNDSLRIFEK